MANKTLTFHPIKESFYYPVGEYIYKQIYIVEEYADLIKNKIFPNRSDETLGIWCRGSSGSIISGLLVYLLKDSFKEVYINHVKKDGEISHADSMDFTNTDYNIIVDDIVATGDTMINILEKINEYYNYKSSSSDLIPINIDALLITGTVTTDRIINYCFNNKMYIGNITGSKMKYGQNLVSYKCTYQYDDNTKKLVLIE